MGARSEASLATFLLVNHLDQDGAPPLSTGEFWKLVAAVGEPSSLREVPEEEIAGLTGAPPDVVARVHSLLTKGRGAALALEQLEQAGIRALTPFDEAYPERLLERLGQTAPPLLFYAGDPWLLDAPCIAIVGSRHVGEEELAVARSAASAASGRGVVVASGAARGVDQVAMVAAVNEGGSVAGVIADSLLKHLRDPDTRRMILDGRAVFLSHRKPSAGFTVGAAMGRNKIVYALAEVTFVVTATANKGGTWAGADEALSRNYGRVAAWMGESRGPGNELLVERGADPIVDVNQLFTLPARESVTAVDERAQLRLGL